MPIEDPNCSLCSLVNWCASPCLQGKGDLDTAKLAIFTDAPAYLDDVRHRPYVSDGAQILEYMLARMGLDLIRDVRLDYTLKCYAGKKLPSKKRDRLVCIEACSTYRIATLQAMPNLKTIMAMGRTSLEAFNGSSELSAFAEECWTPREPSVRELGVRHIWVSYSPLYLIEKPAESPEVYRTLWKAAEEAGLNPTTTKVPPIAWPESK